MAGCVPQCGSWPTGSLALHAAGKLHRDIKPSNVIVTREGRVVLLDFGLAAEQDPDGQHRSTEEHLVGTAAYMAPEQAANPPVSAASDWYSVGVMLFEALTGRLPFLGSALSVLMDKQRFEPPAPGELAPDVPEDLNALCVDLLRRQPEDRPRRTRSPCAGWEAMGPTEDSSATGNRAHFLNVTAGPRQPSRWSAASGIARRSRRRLTAMCLGRTVAVYLHGPSGAGKTALLQSFLDQRLERGDAAILAGRCYERESVPYKALDSLIDALGRHLRRLPEAEAAALLPRDVGSLARVFPSLRRVEAVVQSPRRGFASPDPQELRRRAFSALRELLARLGDRTPLILAIDDLQWGDVDSAALLVELLRPPDAPVLLFLGTYRSEDRETSPFLQAVFEAQGLADNQNQVSSSESGLDCRELGVDLLEHEEASALALALLSESESSNRPPARPGRRDRPRVGGQPVLRRRAGTARSGRSARANGKPAAGRPAATLQQPRNRASWCWTRCSGRGSERLPEEARRVLELIAISGRPLRLAELGQCAELAQDERVALALLRSGRLIRSTGAGRDRRGRDLSRPDPRDGRRPARAGGGARIITAPGASARGLGPGRSRGAGLALPRGRPAGASGRLLRRRPPTRPPRPWPSSERRLCTAGRSSSSQARAPRTSPSCAAGRRPGQRRPRCRGGGRLPRGRGARDGRRRARAPAPRRHAVPDQRAHRRGARNA